MAVKEVNALIRAKDVTGDSCLIYPITKAENVDGLTEALALLASSESVNNAKNEAISTAAADATSKANQAVTDSKTYTDMIASTKSDTTHNHDEDYDALGAANTALDSAKSYTDTKVSDLASTVDSKISTHNTSTSAHNDIRVSISDLTTKLNKFLDVDDTTVDQLSEVLVLIDNNRDTLESLTTSKVNVSDIIDNLSTNSTSKVLSAAQGVVIQTLIDALQVEINTLDAGKANATHSHSISDVTNLQSALDVKANSADIAKTVYTAASNSSPIYVKVSDFGAWGTGAWYQKGFSMLLTSRAGELVWVSVSADDSNTNAKAFRLINTHTKINNVYYSASESAIYCRMVAWCNNLCAHILTNVNGDYVPTVAQASALPSDAVEINIVEFGVSNSGTQVGDTSMNLLLGGAATRPTYNGNDVALKSDVDAVTLDTLGGNDRYYTETEVDTKVETLNTAISGKAASSHTHDDRYYTESEIDAKVATLNTAISGNAATSTRPTGFTGQQSSWSWGITTAENGYTQLTDWTHNGGEIAFSEKDGQVFCQLDGYFYQREGSSRCLDETDLSSINSAISGKASSSHTHSAATTSAAGFMSASDKSKLDGIATGANAYSLPTATSSTLGGVKVGSNITNSSGTISLTKANVTSALGYTPPTTNTTYSFSASNPTLSWGGTSTIGTAGGTTYKVTMPSNPNTWRGIQNNLTSTSTSDSLSAYQGKVLNDKLADKASVSEANTYNGEQKFQHSQYCPTAQDSAYGVGAAYKASRGAVNQEIVGQIIMPTTTVSDSYGCDNTANTIKFQKITATNDGVPTLSTVATLTDSYLEVPALKLGTTSYGTQELYENQSPLATGTIYIVYE